MFAQKKKTTTPVKAMSVFEQLEDRRMFSASAGVGGEALLPKGPAPTTYSISFTQTVNKATPKL